MERWKQVIGYEGLYEVSDQGRVRSVDRIVPHKRFGSIKLKGKIKSTEAIGHCRIQLWKDNILQNVTVHRLVLEAFIGPCPNGYEACHNNGIPSDNNLYNLRWDTCSGNNFDKRKHGTNRGRKVRRSDGEVFNSITEAAESVGLYKGRGIGDIWRVCNGRRTKAYNYGWEYAR